MKNNVLTDFAFTLTHVYLKLCKKDESIWNFRRKLIEEMPSLISIPAEVAFTSELLEKSAKCFQIYSHRKWLVNKLLKSHDWGNFIISYYLIKKDIIRLFFYSYK